MFVSRLGSVSLALAGALSAAGIATTTPAVAVVTAPSHASCTAQHSDAAMPEFMSLERPEFAVKAGYFGTTAVRVDLDASGNVQSASVLKTSGYKVLDTAALSGVRTAKFIPEKVDCQGIAGSYEADVSYEE